MNFIHPQIFYAAPLLLAAVVILSISAARRRRRKLAALLGGSASDPDAVKLSPGRRRIRNGCLLLAMLCLIAAAARPFWDSQLVPYEPHGRDLMVLFDVSKSMRATDIAPSRLEHAKFLLRQLVEADPGDRFGLVAFAGTAYLACPLTSDQLAFNQYIDELSTDSVPLGGTNLELALNTAMTAFKAAAAGNRAIILMTDGDELTGDSSRIVGELKKKEIPLFVIGFGDPEVGAPVPEEDGTLKRERDGKLVTTRLNEVNLRRLAAETGGIYVRSTVTDTGLAAVENRIKRLDQADQEGGRRTVPVEKFPLALIAAGILLLIYFLISERPFESRRRASKAALILVGLLYGTFSQAEPASIPAPVPLSVTAQPAVPDLPAARTAPENRTEGAVNVEPELPDTPEELYNVAREKQLAGDEKALQLYEDVIRQAEGRPDLQARALHNLGTGEHLQVRKGFSGAMAQVQAQQLDPALQALNQAESRAKSAEELYVRSLSIPQNDAAFSASAANLQQLADDRKKIEELKQKIEELKKLQQQTRQQTQQAKQQNQQNQQNQQKSADQSLDDARRSAEELKQKAEEIKQQDLSKRAQQAKEELDRAKRSREENRKDEADQHLEKALEALGGSDQDQKDQKDQKGDQEKKQQEQQAPETRQSQPQPQPQQSEQQEGKMDEKTAGQLLEMMADEEKQLRDNLKKLQRGRQPRMEKDW